MKRPYVILNAATTLDGKIATKDGDSKISSKEDINRLHELRKEVDAVLIGVGTVLADNPALTVRHAEGSNPIRIVADSRARTPPDSKVLDDSAPTIIATSNKAAAPDVQKLRDVGAQVIIAGEGVVDLSKVLQQLYNQGVKKLLLEGGSELNWSMLKQGLVDEVRITVSPRIIGGVGAKSLVGGDGVSKISDSIKLELCSVQKSEGDVLLVYKVKGVESVEKVE